MAKESPNENERVEEEPEFEPAEERAEDKASQQGHVQGGEDGNPGQSDAATELAGAKDRVLRLQAEMENLRSRTAREILDSQRYAPLPLVRDLLPVVDNIERAIEAAEQETDRGALLEGFKMVQQQLLSILERHHCKPIQALGEPFDPQIHEAISQQPSEEVPPNHVAMVAQPGYQLHDRVVRPSQVIISTGPQ